MLLNDFFKVVEKGGPNSGNRGHSGRPGKRGGSAASSSGGNFADISHEKMLSHYKDYSEKLYYEEDDIQSGKIKRNWVTMFLRGYAGTDYEEINGFLRKGKLKRYSVDNNINHIDKGINEAPRVPENITVFRYAGKKFLKSLVPGTVFEDKGYVSTSIDRSRTDGQGIQIRVPKGSKAMYMPGIHKKSGGVNPLFQLEQELLLPRNSKFNVISNQDNVVLLELINE